METLTIKIIDEVEIAGDRLLFHATCEGKTYNVSMVNLSIATWAVLNPGTVLKVKGLVNKETNTIRPIIYEVVR